MAEVQLKNIVWPGPRTEADLWMGFVTPYENRYQTGGLQHLYAATIREIIGKKTFDSYYKFIIVRNPWDKAVPQYWYMKRRSDLRKLIGMAPDDTFKTYLRLIQKITHVQWNPQQQFIYDDSGRCLVDKIARYEDYTREVKALLRKLGIRVSSLPHDYSTATVEYSYYYDPESRAVVSRMYARDIELCGYKF